MRRWVALCSGLIAGRHRTVPGCWAGRAEASRPAERGPAGGLGNVQMRPRGGRWRDRAARDGMPSRLADGKGKTPWLDEREDPDLSAVFFGATAIRRVATGLRQLRKRHHQARQAAAPDGSDAPTGRRSYPSSTGTLIGSSTTTRSNHPHRKDKPCNKSKPPAGRSRPPVCQALRLIRAALPLHPGPVRSS